MSTSPLISDRSSMIPHEYSHEYPIAIPWHPDFSYQHFPCPPQVNMACYGQKPPDFLALQPNWQIPVAVIDGTVLRCLWRWAGWGRKLLGDIPIGDISDIPLGDIRNIPLYSSHINDSWWLVPSFGVYISAQRKAVVFQLGDIWYIYIYVYPHCTPCMRWHPMIFFPHPTNDSWWKDLDLQFWWLPRPCHGLGVGRRDSPGQTIPVVGRMVSSRKNTDTCKSNLDTTYWKHFGDFTVISSSSCAADPSSMFSKWRHWSLVPHKGSKRGVPEHGDFQWEYLFLTQWMLWGYQFWRWPYFSEVKRDTDAAMWWSQTSSCCSYDDV